MFACIYGRGFPSISPAEDKKSDKFSPLVELAFTFSPLVEETAIETVVLDVSGQDLLFGQTQLTDEPLLNNDSMGNMGNEIVRHASELNLLVNVAIAANPDVAIHAARCLKGLTVIDPGDALSCLGPISIKDLDYSLAQVEPDHAEQIQETFALWGVRTFADLARLPLSGVAARLGQEGVRLQKLVQGQTHRHLNLVRPPIGFEQSLELEHHVTELEPLSFILSRLLNQLCANLREYALATNELRWRLVTAPRHVGVTSGAGAAANSIPEYERAITLPIPMCDPKTLLRLLLLEIEREPPPAPIIAVTVRAEPVKPHASQTGLFIPLAPEPEKLEITLARLAKLVGEENVGSPEILDTHRPDAFRMKRFILNHRGRTGRNPKAGIDRQSAIGSRQCVMGLRIFRPAWHADVRTQRGIPSRIHARSEEMSNRIHGKVVCAAGPWRASGDWWRSDAWARDEWDVAVVDPAKETQLLCRIYRDLTNEEWFVAGVYD
jgi:protein ImuB